MKLKIFSLFLLTAILSIIAVSAATNFTVSTSTIQFIEPQTSLSFTLTPLVANSSFAVDLPIIFDNNNNLIPLSVSGNLIDISSSQIITINTALDYSQISLDKTYLGNIIVRNLNNANDNQTIALKFVKSFCKFGENGTELSISEVKVKNNVGSDDTEWRPLDEIEIDVRVENTGTNKVRGVNVEIGLLGPNGRNIINNMDSLSDKKISLGTIDEGDESTPAKFTFTVPIDFNVDDYKLIVKAYSTNKGEKALCISHASDLDNNFYQSIVGSRESTENKQIVVTNIVVSPDTAQCSDKVQVSADIVNIGDTDYTDQVKVNMYNNELGININKIIKQDFDQGDSSIADFEFDVPNNAKEKSYLLYFRTYYDYDTSRDSYRITSSDTFTNSDSPFKVEGGCQPVTPSNINVNGQITSTSLSDQTPEAIAGKEAIVMATIKNTGDVATTYTVSVSGNSAWSNLISIDPQTLTISPGSSKDVSINLNIDNNAEGTKSFTIRLDYTNKSTEFNVQDFSITKQSVQSDVVLQHLKDNWFIYVIILVNVILIIAIIMVVRRMMRPRVPRM